MDAAAMNRFLDEHPAIRNATMDFMSLLDAADVLERTQPATGMQPAVREYLDKTGRSLMKRAGLPEDFVEACVRSRPPREV